MKRTAVALLTTLALLAPGAASAATITPNITADSTINADGNCSLREAVEAANDDASGVGCADDFSGGFAAGGPDTVTLPAASYTLSIDPIADENSNANGDLDTTGSLQINGTNPGGTSITQTDLDRIFDLRLTNRSLGLNGLLLLGGNVTSYSAADARGGAIRSELLGQTLALDDVVVDGNQAQFGGGIYSSGAGNLVSIVDSTLEDNTAASQGDNALGGAITQLTSGAITIVRSNLNTNHAVNAFAGDDAIGGAIRSTADSVTITDSTLSDNDASNTGVSTADAHGGGVAVDSTTTITRSLLTANSADTVQAGRAEQGGAIYVVGTAVDEPVTVVNSTLHDNSAGGPAPDDGVGGAVFNNGPGPVALRHVTFSGNDASDAGDSVYALGGTTTLRASINPSQDDPCAGNPGTISSTGFNAAAIGDPDCNYIASDSTSGGLIGIQSGGPADNGGFTDTIGLNAGGRAVDLVPAASCTDSQDQRGFFRPSGAGCDAGAYERVICNGIVQEGPGAIDCPPPPVIGQPTPITTPQATLKKKCKKPKKKKGKKASAAAKKKPKGCKKKKRKKK